MGVQPAIFQTVGRRTEHLVPGAYSRSTAAGGASGGISANNGVILGRSRGGQPRRLFVFSTLDEARQTLSDGELLKAVAHAFTPSPQFSPQRVMAMAVNGNTQAARRLKAGGAEVIRARTATWGLDANRVSMQIVDGSERGTKKLRLSFGEMEEAIDNIGKRSMRLQYTGVGSAVLDIDNQGLYVKVTGGGGPEVEAEGMERLRVGEAREITVKAFNPEAAGAVVAKIEIEGIGPELLNFESLEAPGSWKPLDISAPFKLEGGAAKLRVTPLAGAGGKTVRYRVVLQEAATGAEAACTSYGQTEVAAEGQPFSSFFVPACDAGSGSVFLPFEDYPTVETIVRRLNDTGKFAAALFDEDDESPSRELDAVISLDLSEPKVLTSDFHALLSALENSPWIGRGNVEKTRGAPNAMPDNDPEPVYFEGASAGTHTVEDWARALAALETENVQIISTPSTDPAVHVLISKHCKAMSGVQNRKERTALLGGRAGETVAEAVEFARQLNNKLVSYCHPAITAMSPLTGRPEDLPASYFACKLLGLECSVAVNEPLTWKTVSVLRFAAKLTVPEMERLIAGGVLCGGTTDDNRLAVIRAMTTHNGPQLQLVERSMVRQDLYMNRDIRHQYSLGIGRPGVDKGADIEETLHGAARKWSGEGLIIPTDEGLNVWGVKTRKVGDKNFIEFHRNLTAPNNFFFITAYNYVYDSGTSLEL